MVHYFQVNGTAVGAQVPKDIGIDSGLNAVDFMFLRRVEKDAPAEMFGLSESMKSIFA